MKCHQITEIQIKFQSNQRFSNQGFFTQIRSPHVIQSWFKFDFAHQWFLDCIFALGGQLDGCIVFLAASKWMYVSLCVCCFVNVAGFMCVLRRRSRLYTSQLPSIGKQVAPRQTPRHRLCRCLYGKLHSLSKKQLVIWLSITATHVGWFW